MSEFHVVEVCFKDENVLVQSLKDIGYKPTVHAEGVTLNNSYSRSKPTAHIVIKQTQIGGYGDIGFERTKNGFVMHADNADVGGSRNRFNLKKLNLTYVENKVKKYVNSTVNCNIFSRRENEKGQVEIKLRITI